MLHLSQLHKPGCASAPQAEVVQQLQVVSLKNHAEQLQEDPTSKLTKVRQGQLLCMPARQTC